MLLAFDYESFDGEVDTTELVEWREAATEEEPTMHVKMTPTGAWHRATVDRSHTACGEPLGAFASRDESYEGRLCTNGCFSGYELGLASEVRDAADLEQRERQRRAETDSHLTDDIAESRVEHRRRLDRATGRHRSPDGEKK